MYADRNANYPQVPSTLTAGQVQSLNQAPCLPPKQSVSNEIINRMEGLNSTLLSILDHQQGLIDRLHGASPTAGIAEGKNVAGGGLLSAIDERMNWLVSNAQKILENQCKLNNLA